MKLSQRILNIEESKTTGLMDLVQQMQASGTEVISFNAGEPDFNSPEPILQATIEALKAGKTKYSAVPGLPALRKAIAEKVQKENGIAAEAANILIANGSKQILYNVFQAICNPGDEVIIPSPYWVTFPEIVKLAGGTPVFVDTQDHQLDLEKIEAAITPKTCAILVNSPNNPTGAVFSEASLRAVGQLALKHEIYVVSDEAYAGLTYDGAKHLSLAALDPAFAPWVITTQSFSKDYCMTGFRVGFLVADKALVKAINNLHSHLTGNVCTFAQFGAIAALEMDPQIMLQMQETFQRRLDIAYPLCTEIFDCVKPQGAFYLFPNVEKYLGERFADDDALAEYLLKEAHVAVVPGSSFGAPGHLRISFSTSEENIRKGFERIKKALVG
ncbi:pyridoxal phosphate-dependent aminotransferase [bacterium (Candidatus Blackallbacteria) CG17_big_fil_post_rev_8_21_14_2_50_48_46]|uniref:Pyridoxal phosphate-dependent aminotransferase n=1 Tax=bacterium (Candidatus Blackallbacteria) CG17_big_fil_post_rev_8_21_14_2_50_48_46 TaxID=2014261 RepID=A0A2M7G3J8_9BACT|nr:MAG: aminotransferase class I and II [bacterium (Candidatus Blackallbacteria) CG18_big_fil_WC_8_21_14_2_50_49_26]PIW16435.1 MAG: pyridoxal phosphate-dependent aminotransferase [bacterium (Candidatus Blackallbacteria) CG17_big_fil_post_rev_8_21_14_2_50_48_46]PIW45943.1 MAG: pyridoxal phosphate-dependent aminotransferase [bacterium (Candidatus Blackallbacteria) CG13_big_fil_rev_8_21_14_2_50_49_14]